MRWLLPVVSLLSVLLLWVNIALRRTPPVGTTAEATALWAQLAWLEPRMHHGLPDELQRQFPEGRTFSHALYALSWQGLAARLPQHKALRAHAAREVRWAYDEMGTPASRVQFPALAHPPYGVFHAGWRNQVLAALVDLEPLDTALAAAFDTSSQVIAQAFAASPSPYLESYTQQAWPADAVVALHSLRLHERLRGADHGAVIARWVEQVRTRYDSLDMVPHAWDPYTDAVHQNARGSSLALINVFLPDIDSALAAQQFRNWKGMFILERFGVPAVREHPIGNGAPGDVDSGPLILGYGPAATIVGMATCKRNGDAFHATECARTVHGFGLATGGGAQHYLFGAMPIADLFIAWTRSMPCDELQGAPPGYNRFTGWCALLLLLLWCPWLARAWQRLRR